jgi:hypothetical protein
VPPQQGQEEVKPAEPVILDNQGSDPFQANGSMTNTSTSPISSSTTTSSTGGLAQ